MGVGYAREKTVVAIQGMAASHLSLRDRVADAYTGSLFLIRPSEHLPAPEMQQLFQEIEDALSVARPRDGEGSAVASLRSMSDAEVTQIARNIVKLWSLVCCEVGAIPAG
jgi:hypothetical protein